MEIGIGKALEYSGLGIAIVFALIIVLMIVVKIMTTIVRGAIAARDKAAANASAAKGAGANPAAANAAMAKGGAASGRGAGTASTTDTGAEKKALAPGSVGDVKLYDVPDRDAAMIMAIVARQLNAPLNELRFLSIREVKEDEV